MIRVEAKNKGVEVFCSGNKHDLMGEFLSVCSTMKKILTDEEYNSIVLISASKLKDRKTKEQKEEDFFKSLLLDLLKESGKDPECDIEDFE